MIAVDTNIVVRLIVDDNQGQIAAIRALLERQAFLVPLTVLLECYWVLKSRYSYSDEQIGSALVGLSNLDGISFQGGNRANWALERFQAGADFADVIHVAASEDVTVFATFDRLIERRAGSECPLGIMTLT